MYLALGIIFLIYTLLLAAAIALTLVFSIRNGDELISKKNLLYLAPTFLNIYFLYLTASAFNGADIDFFYCFSLIDTALDVFKFEAAKSLLLPICKAYPIYYADFVFAFLAGSVTVILSIASFFGQRIRNYFAVNRSLKRNCDIVLGDSDDALQYVKNNKGSIVLGTGIGRQRYADLLKSGITVLKSPLAARTVLRKCKKGEHSIIVFRDGKYSYTEILEQFTQIRTNGGNVYLHLEARQDEMKILKEKFVAKANGAVGAYIFCFSKYELMARRFVVDYPITKYIPRDFYNRNCTLKSDKQINVVFVGFGKVNYQIFRMCAMQFQFAQQSGDKLCAKPVNYHIFDNSDSALHNEFFSRIQYEFDEEFKNCDFPKPEKICELDIRRTDINSVEAKKAFKELVTDDSFTYFIISLNDDLEDASYARTVKRLLQNEKNYRIFVRAKNNCGERLNSEEDSVIYFGDEKNLYTHANIVNDDLTELAQRINLLYNTVSDVPVWLKKIQTAAPTEQGRLLEEELQASDKKQLLLQKWAKLLPIEQASNLYHALNLPFKLNMLGLRMVRRPHENDRGISETKFNEYYINSGRASGYDDYSFYFRNESSNVLAYIEHSRWNALYIFYDYKQMPKRDMQVINGNMVHKDAKRKLHACLTTYYGLDELIRFKFSALYPDVKPANGDERLLELGKIYRYDYMDLDRLYGEITAMGYKLEENE